VSLAPGDAYEQLGAKVDAFFGRVRVRYPGALTCHQGCASCCHQHLSVVVAEFRRVAAAALELPAADQEALRARLAAGRADPRCPLLDDVGACRVYAARPMICRSHGLPIEAGAPSERDVCPLNFTAGPPLEELDPGCVLDVERLNAILLAVDAAEGRGDGARVDLFDGLTAVLADAQAGAAG